MVIILLQYSQDLFFFGNFSRENKLAVNFKRGHLYNFFLQSVLKIGIVDKLGFYAVLFNNGFNP